MNKINKILIVVFVVFVLISIFWIYEEYILRDNFEVYYSEDGIPEVEE